MSRELVDLMDNTMGAIRQTMMSGVSHQSLAIAQGHVLQLATRQDLFSPDRFPLPTDTTDRTFLVHDTDGEFALYVCTNRPGLEYGPHDHGGSWAVIAAVSGAEQHRFYSIENERPRVIAEATCEPGSAISMLPGDIHSIHAGDEPLVHLHLYGLAFERQTERREFDSATGLERRFVLENFTFVEDRR